MVPLDALRRDVVGQVITLFRSAVRGSVVVLHFGYDGALKAVSANPGVPREELARRVDALFNESDAAVGAL